MSSMMSTDEMTEGSEKKAILKFVTLFGIAVNDSQRGKHLICIQYWLFQ
jgi:hypothetical protein